MPAKVILDTDILSEYLKGYDTVVVTNAERYASEHGVFTFTSVTVHEIIYGLELKNAKTQLRKVKAWLEQNETITPVADDLHCSSLPASGGAAARLGAGVGGLPDRGDRP